MFFLSYGVCILIFYMNITKTETCLAELKKALLKPIMFKLGIEWQERRKAVQANEQHEKILKA